MKMPFPHQVFPSQLIFHRHHRQQLLLFRKELANETFMLQVVFVSRMRASSLSSSFSSPWPDPNSLVLSKINFGVPLDELFKWLDVRDTLLGHNKRSQDFPAALALARDCKHPDALWLTSLFEGKDVSTKEDARNIFLRSFENDARALCFAWWLADDRKEALSLLRRSSELGNAFACSTLCCEVWCENKEEAFRLARYAASLRERDGFRMLGRCFNEGVGCEIDLNLAKKFFLIALELGGIFAGVFYARLLDEYDPARWLWLERLALRGWPGPFLAFFSKPVKQLFCASGNASVVFLIGRILRGNIDVEKGAIFGQSYNFDSLIGPTNQAVSFFSSQSKSARVAVDTWTLVAARLHLIKDMRIYIGKMIWDVRCEAIYKVSVRAVRAQKKDRE